MRGSDRRRGFDARALLPLLVIVAGLAAYANSFSGAFVLDDDKHILNNPRIRTIFPLGETLSGRRPVVDLTLAINHALADKNAKGVDEPFGYHVFNVTVHLLAGLTLFGIVRRTLLSERLRPRFVDSAPWLALAVSVLWIVHPLQTQSVNYLIQRAESMMGLFYLLTLYCVIRGANGRWGLPWYLPAVLACGLGMGTKGVMITAPLAVLIYDRLFLSRSAYELLRGRWPLYLGLFATWFVLAWTGVAEGVLAPQGKTATVGFGYRGIPPWEYLLTQAGVLVHYFRLAVWPVPLCLDYGWPVTRSVSGAVAAGVLVILVLRATYVGFVRRHAAAFAGVFFFLVLIPTSSIVPIKDPIFEHRMYLPMAAVIAITVTGGFALVRTIATASPHRPHFSTPVGTVLAVAATIAGVVVTRQRNEDYQSAKVMWQDVVTKRPKHARAYLGLGTLVFDEAKASRVAGRVDEAKARFLQAERAFALAVKFKPNYADGYYNLGNSLVETNKLNEAVSAFLRSLEINPRHARCHYNLANAYKRMNRLDDAIRSYQRTVEVKPDHKSAHINLGNTLKMQGRLDEAIASYRRAITIDPRYANARLNLGSALRDQGRLREAVEEFRLALQYNPTPQQRDLAQRALNATLAQLGE